MSKRGASSRGLIGAVVGLICLAAAAVALAVSGRVEHLSTTAKPVSAKNGFAQWPDVAGFGHDGAVAVWDQYLPSSPTGRYEIETRTLTPTGAWGVTTNLSGAKYAGIQPIVRTTPAGGAVVFWDTSPGYPAGNNGETSGLMAASRKSALAPWTTSLISSDCGGAVTSTAQGANGTVSVVCSAEPKKHEAEIQLLTYSIATATWTKPVVIASSDSEFLLDPSIAEDAHGTTVVSWMRPTGGPDVDDLSGDLGVSVKRPGAGWHKTPALASHLFVSEGGSELGQPTPTIAVDSRGKAIIVWPSINSSDAAGYAELGSGGWVKGKVPESAGSDPAVVTTPAGQATVSWQPHRGNPRRTYAAAVNLQTGEWTSARTVGPVGKYDGNVTGIYAGRAGVATIEWLVGKELYVAHRTAAAGSWTVMERLNVGRVDYLSLAGIWSKSAVATWLYSSSHKAEHDALLARRVRL